MNLVSKETDTLLLFCNSGPQLDNGFILVQYCLWVHIAFISGILCRSGFGFRVLTFQIVLAVVIVLVQRTVLKYLMSFSRLFWKIIFPSNTLQNVSWVVLQCFVLLYHSGCWAHWWCVTYAFGDSQGKVSLFTHHPITEIQPRHRPVIVWLFLKTRMHSFWSS